MSTAIAPANKYGQCDRNHCYRVQLESDRAKLIEALRDVVRAYDGTGGVKGLAQQTAAEGARVLLRELGESV